MGGLCPLFFDGAVCNFVELPRPEEKRNIQKIYEYIESKNKISNKSFFSYVINKFRNKLFK